jgi:hypothetical protein
MSITLTQHYRTNQAQLYAAQLRARKAMGDQYAHAPTNHPCLSA